MRRACTAAATLLMVLAGCGGGGGAKHHAGPILLKPIDGGVIAPQPAPAASCVVKLGHGAPGACAPLQGANPKPLTFALAYPATILDVSNNDPISCSDWARVNTAGAYLKLNESTGFIDSTAGPQAACARQFKPNMYLGGYDFLHVCGPAPRDEAQVFIGRVLALRLNGPRTLPPAGDAEYGSCSSAAQARSWISTWYLTVVSALHRADIYTGSWYFDPTFGCFWLPGAAAWISGYGVSWPFMPCGRSQLDLWQRTDHGFNGASNADLSVWVRSQAEFQAFVASAPAPRDWLRIGDRGRAVYLLTHRLAIAGWLSHSGSFYSRHVAIAVRAYQVHHGLHPASGTAGRRTQQAIKATAERDRKHHVRDTPRPV